MRTVLWVVGLFIAVCGIALPGLYLLYASQLPPLESEFDLERRLRGYVEGERMSQRAGSDDERKLPTAWPRPNFQVLPRDLVALYISSQRCPGFFQTPREQSAKAMLRVFRAFILNQPTEGANGRCELLFASHLTYAVRISGDWQGGIAALRIRNFLSKDQLVAYDLDSRGFGKGVFGVADVSRVIFHKKPSELTLAQQAELMLVFQPDAVFEDLALCKGPLVLKQVRDDILDQLGRDALVPLERIKQAKDEPLTCLKD